MYIGFSERGKEEKEEGAGTKAKNNSFIKTITHIIHTNGSTNNEHWWIHQR